MINRRFDISKGNIKITKNNDNNDMVTVTVGTTSYDIPKNMEIYIDSINKSNK